MKCVRYCAAPLLLMLIMHAPSSYADSGWLVAAPLQGLSVSNKGRYTIEMEVEKNISGCSNPRLFYIDFEAIGAEQAYQLLLRSMLAERAVQLYVTGRCALKGVAEVSAVRLPAKP
ncbi:hypothetical protein DU002_12395 [Corallincola holothuriorum]|uniref:Uncharacterized protein n=1 Tax=Corallincola holothuriorum TaxID=2282215 RepID=A0A368NF91_9GAMM|nr:hypothetical protein [Corallincola holothuriorum]RCU49148.1 hypothetical protein DU002_12395 [Corallincola holothuriorum]